MQAILESPVADAAITSAGEGVSLVLYTVQRALYSLAGCLAACLPGRHSDGGHVRLQGDACGLACPWVLRTEARDA